MEKQNTTEKPNSTNTQKDSQPTNQEAAAEKIQTTTTTPIRSRNTFQETMKSAFPNIPEILACTNSNFENYCLSEKEKINIEKLILRSSPSTLRIEEKSELKFYFHKYIVKSDSGELIIVNRNFKNIYKKKVDQMKSDEKILRKLLLDMFSDQIAVYKISNFFELENYNNAIKTLPKNLRIEKDQKFESFFIYVIGMHYVFNVIAEPKISEYESYCNKLQEQLRYLIAKEEYTQAISIMNKLLKNYFENKNFVNELKAKKELKAKCDKILERIVSNKVFCLTKKESGDDNKRKDYEEALKALDDEYFKNFKLKKNADENLFAKNLARKATLFIKTKNLEKSLETLEKLKVELPAQHALIEQVHNEVEAFKLSLQNFNEKKHKNFKRNLIQGLAEIEDEGCGFDQWDLATEEIDLGVNIDAGIIEYMLD
jgi:tetratricopeptide (TPR) repeat protein